MLLSLAMTRTFHDLRWIADAVAQRVVRRRYCCHYDRDDARQHALLGLCEALNTYDPKRCNSLQTHCWSVALRRCIDGYRHAVGTGARQRLTVGTRPLKAVPEAACARVHRPFRRVDAADRIDFLFRRQSAERRVAAKMLWGEGYTLREIAALMGTRHARLGAELRTLRWEVRRG